MQILSNRLNNMSYSQTLEMALKARELKEKGVDIINLSLGEPDFIPPNFILNSAKKAIDNGHHYYTPVSGYLDLKEVICEKFKRDNLLNYSPNQIVVSNGCKQSIINIFLSLLNRGDEVIIPVPYWVSYYEMVKLCEAKPVFIKTSLKSNFKISPEDLDKVISLKSKIFIFSTPCNPSGSIYSKKELKSLVEVFKKYPNLIIISDEIYEHINYTNKNITSIASFSEVYEQTVTLNGLSKSFAMTGWRVGYMAGPIWLSKACEKIQGQTTSGVNAIAQCAAISALKASPNVINYMIKSFKKRRDLVINLFSKITELELNKPEGAFYIFPKVSKFFIKKKYNNKIKNSHDLSMFFLEKANVATVSGKAFGDENHLRISYAISSKKLKLAFNRIKKSLYYFNK